MWAAFRPDSRAWFTNILAAFEGLAIVVPTSLWCSPVAGHSRSRKISHTSSSKSSPLPTDVLLNSYRTAAALTSPSFGKTDTSCPIDSNLTLADRLVLCNLLQDAAPLNPCDDRSTVEARDLTRDAQTLDDLAAFSNPTNPLFQPIVFTTWDNSDFPTWINTYVLQP